MILQTLLVLFAALKCHALYEDNSAIVNLNTNNFDTLVKNSKSVWVVEFFAPWCGHCQNFAGEYEKAAKALEGIVKVGAVNADAEPALASEYNVPGYPTVKIFNAKKGAPQNYDGERTAKGLVSFLSTVLQKRINSRLFGDFDRMFKYKDVVQLTASNFDHQVLQDQEMWLLVFYSTSCERCQKLSAQWTKVFGELGGLIKLGALDAMDHSSKAAECQVKSYPTIRFYPPGEKTATSGDDYSGPLKSATLTEWALDKISDHTPAPDVTQIVDFDSLKACDGKPLCVLSFLPQILDCQADCRNNYLQILKDVSSKYKSSKWGWVWSEGGAQPDMEAALEIGGFGYPALAAVNVKKMKYSLFVGSFSFDGINEFLRDLSYGRGDSKPITLKQVPPVKTVEPWDGLNSELPSEDEVTDFPLLPDAIVGTKDEL